MNMQDQEPGICGVCSQQLAGGHMKLLFGHRVHAACRNKFDLRREVAYVIDILAAFVLLTVTVGPVMGERGDVGEGTEGGIRATVVVALELIVFGLFLAKDAVKGISPGKLLMGLQVVDAQSDRPIGLRQSLMRNLILLIPFMPVVLAFQMRGGPRWGEGWAGTRVVLRKRRDAPAFISVTPQPEDWSSGPRTDPAAQ